MNLNDYQAPPGLLASRVILVAGASGGLGRACARAYAAHGASVILHGRSVPKLEALYDEIVAAGHPEPAILPLDFNSASERDFELVAQHVEKTFGRLDGLHHCAATFFNLSPLDIQTLDQWLNLLRVNVAAAFALTRACAPLLRAAPDASVLLTGETHGLAPAAYWGGFAVSKSALETLVKIWASEWERSPHLRINLLVPGPMHSPQRARSHPAEDKTALPTPEALLPTCLYLMGPDSFGVSGRTLRA
jgi:NAD(P)-dependent dehydrogenase (short-subunit alcohol dehydrogenase family)